MSDLTMSDRHLMWLMGDHVKGVQPGSFSEAMFEAAIKADEFNLRKIGLGFPQIAESIEKWRSSPDGWGLVMAAAAEIEPDISHVGRLDAALVLHPEGGQSVLVPHLGPDEDVPRHVLLISALACRLTEAGFDDECLEWFASQANDRRLPGWDTTFDDGGPDPELSGAAP